MPKAALSLSPSAPCRCGNIWVLCECRHAGYLLAGLFSEGDSARLQWAVAAETAVRRHPVLATLPGGARCQNRSPSVSGHVEESPAWRYPGGARIMRCWLIPCVAGSGRWLGSAAVGGSRRNRYGIASGFRAIERTSVGRKPDAMRLRPR